MAAVDYERAWLALKAQIVGKASHGRRDLCVAMTQIELDCRVEEGQEGFNPAPPRAKKKTPTVVASPASRRREPVGHV